MVHTREEAVRRLHIGQRRDIEIGDQFEPPVALTVTGAGPDTLLRVSRLEVVGIEVDRLPASSSSSKGP